MVDGKQIKPVSSVTKDEEFIRKNSKEYVISGLTRNLYNENMKIFYASTVIPKDAKTSSFVRFHNFRKAYSNKDNLEKEIASALNKEEIKERLSECENASQRAKKFIRLAESYSNFEELTPTIINEFISKIVVHERDVKRAKYVVQRIEVYFNYIGKFENELTKQIEPTEQEMLQMREEIEEEKREKSRAYHREYSKKYRAKNLEKCREYEKLKAREYRAKKKLQAMT